MCNDLYWAIRKHNAEPQLLYWYNSKSHYVDSYRNLTSAKEHYQNNHFVFLLLIISN